MKQRLRFIERYDIEAMARAVFNAGIHLTDGRHEWLQLMMSMAGGGERLLDSFLLLASMAGRKYKERESRREFLKKVRLSSDPGLKFFIDRCREKGIEPNDYLAPAALADSYSSRSHRKHRNNQKKTNQPQPNPMQPSTMQPLAITPVKTIDPDWVTKFGRGQDSTFHRSVVVAGLLTADELQAASELFHLGTTRDKRVVYWQIDAEGRVRDGKLMQYDERCHRVKSADGTGRSVSWAGFELRQCGQLGKDWEAAHCLFGLHQLNARPEDTVCIVEAEKTAVICSQKIKDCIWMAAGGMEQLNVDKLRPLQGRQVILYPDTDPEGEAFQRWYDIAWRARCELELDIAISDVLEKNATPEQKAAKIDIVDFIEKDILNAAADASVAEDMPVTEDAPVIEEAVIVEKPKPSNTQMVVDEQREIRDAKLMSQTEMLDSMAEENSELDFFVDVFGVVPEDSS